MTATKSSRAGTLVAVLILGATLALNVYLWRRSHPAAAVAAAASAPAKTPATPSAPVLNTTAFATEADLTTLRDTLRAAGASDTRIREIFYGVLRRRYRIAETEKRLTRIQRGWWKDDQRTLGIVRASRWLVDDPGMLIDMVDDPMVALLGPDPTQVDVVNARYSFLPEETRFKLAALDRDLGRAEVATGDPVADSKMEKEFIAKNLANREAREKLLAGLTPEQRREYDMHYGATGTRIASMLSTMPDATESEFRQLYAIAEKAGGTPNSPAFTAANATAVFMVAQGNGTGSVQILATSAAPVQNAAAMTPQAQAEATQRANAEIVATLGYDRALNIIWSSTTEYRAITALAQDGSVSAAVAAPFTQLAAETGSKALAIHQNAALDADQKRAALLALQQTARSQVDALLPADVQKKLPPTALTWLNQMSDGRYKVMAPGSIDRLGGSSATLSLTSASAPSLPPTFTVLPPSRPASN